MNRRRAATALVPLGVLASALMTIAPSSAAPPTSCEGRPLTHLGTTGQPLVTTEGDDVVVSNGATSVDTLGGDDVVCLTKGAGPVQQNLPVDVGAGADRVSAVPGAQLPGVDVVLGDGADRFEYDASRFGYTVDAGDRLGGVTDDDADEVLAGGNPTVYAGDGGVVDDVIRFLSGHGTLYLDAVGLGPTGVLDGGIGAAWSELVMTDLDGDAWDFDNVAGTATREGQPALRFKGFTDFVLRGADALSFTGNASSEDLVGENLADVDLGANESDLGDRLVVLGTIPEDAGTLSGGPGADELYLTRERTPAERGDLLLDLAAGKLRFERGTPTAGLASFERARVVADGVAVVRGSDRADELYPVACDLRVYAGAGADSVVSNAEPGFYDCEVPRRAEVNGEDGSDYILGERTVGERLIGGADRDRIAGRGGGDRVYGGDGDDSVTGGEHTDHDYLNGGAGDDSLSGYGGDDQLVGGSGADRMEGGRGNDLLDGRSGRDAAYGATGVDTCHAEVRKSCERP